MLHYEGQLDPLTLIRANFDGYSSFRSPQGAFIEATSWPNFSFLNPDFYPKSSTKTMCLRKLVHPSEPTPTLLPPLRLEPLIRHVLSWRWEENPTKIQRSVISVNYLGNKYPGQPLLNKRQITASVTSLPRTRSTRPHRVLEAAYSMPRNIIPVSGMHKLPF